MPAAAADAVGDIQTAILHRERISFMIYIMNGGELRELSKHRRVETGAVFVCLLDENWMAVPTCVLPCFGDCRAVGLAH